ncbi:MAG: gatB [Parcubacteria group bacterium]|nr:gatB [Parcubacteria group bacterium]
MREMSEKKYSPTIGLEVHAELATATKMFCDSPNAPEGAEPNTNICPVCLAHPGTLPVINRVAVEHVLRVGTALGSNLADYTEFDRKSYFYPDIPKGYQISQYEYPLVQGGSLNDVAITRVHLEEDTARSSHAGGSSLVDFNRAGVPLMELVTEPVIHDAKTAGDFARELQLLLRTLGASHANLEKGEMRIEANISVSPNDTFGTKVEVKNLNSFRSVERAIAYEIDRQIALIESGGSVSQETRGWDEGGQKTFSQRVKEGSADYRYFPEPDLPKLILSDMADWKREVLAAALPELPWEKRARYATLGLKTEEAAALAEDLERAAYFDMLISHLEEDASALKIAANYLLNDVGEATPPRVGAFAELVRMIGVGDVSSRGAKDVLKFLMEEEGASARAIAEREGLLQQSDPEALRGLVVSVLADHAGVADEYRAGKQSVLQFLVGQGMKASKGAGNPALIRELMVEELAKSAS